MKGVHPIIAIILMVLIIIATIGFAYVFFSWIIESAKQEPQYTESWECVEWKPTETFLYYTDKPMESLPWNTLIACYNGTITIKQCCDLYMNGTLEKRDDLIRCETEHICTKWVYTRTLIE